MSSLPAIWTAPLGVFAGLLCALFIVHWLTLLLTALGKRPEKNPAPAPGRRFLMIALSILHPVPWLLGIGVPVGLSRLYSDPPSQPWLWFFGAAGVSLIGLFSYSFVVARRATGAAALRTDSDGK